MLHPLIVEATEDTPEVYFSASEGVFRLKGRSLPENAWQFYQPLIEWTRSYCSMYCQDTRIELHMDYFNSSSGRFLFEILTIMELESLDKSRFHVYWYAESEDELMIEKGEELQSLLDLAFTIERV